MKASKMSLVVLLALALTMSLAASSWARGGMGCGMMGAMNLSPDQAGKLFDLKQKFMNETVDVRKQMVVKHAELAALWKAEKPDEKAIVAKQKELNAVKGQMQEKSVAFRLEARKIAPQFGQGFGRGMHGMGCGMGGPGGGMGPGGCGMGGPGGGMMGPGACPMVGGATPPAAAK